MSHLTRGHDFFPFTAIIGQEEMKKGLILNVINPNVGGILVFGEKGTAKSTAVRSISSLLPELSVVKNCAFYCDPGEKEELCPECLAKVQKGETLEKSFARMKVVDLPVSATEDRVVGSLDIERAIKEGVKKFEKGVLAEANRGILYVDEINLLDDHIVDLLLDSAAMGVNTVEREGISFSHPARFILVGTMNPEEGELRPQLLDRFGLCVEIRGIKEPEKRIEIIKLRSEYEDAPKSFIAKYHETEYKLADKIIKAKKMLKTVSLSDAMLEKIVNLSTGLDVDGHRADLTLMKAAKANAAYEERSEVISEDLKAVAKMVFLHRMKSLPFENAKILNTEKINKLINGDV